jgi:HipA-like protein
MSKKDADLPVQSVRVYLEKKKSRVYVGQLTKAKTDGKGMFEFTYDQPYLMKSNSIPLGPEFPLSKQVFQARRLFQSFEDRIPSKKNPAYPEYCKAFGIPADESDPFVLLSTIGRKGPSSFVFEGIRPDVNQGNVADYRSRLGLTVREFASAFDVSTASIQKLERGKGGGEVLKRLQIYMQFPLVALWEIKHNQAKIHENKYRELVNKLSAMQELERDL